MRYSYEFKRRCVDLYRQNRWAECPPNIKNPSDFHHMIRNWVKIEDENGPDALRHKSQNKAWTPDERFELVSRVIKGESVCSVAASAGINNGQLSSWVHKYNALGYDGLNLKKGRNSKAPDMKKKNINNPRKLDESEYEELVRLRAENAYIKAENEVIKKEIALREKREAARLKARKQQSSKNSEKKDSD